MSDEAPKKIKAEQVEVIDAQGQVIQPARDSQHEKASPFGSGGFGRVRVMKAGPMALLLVPILLPLVLVGIIVLMILALLFGKTVFRVFKWKN